MRHEPEPPVDTADISARRRAEERFRSVAESGVVAIAFFDTDGAITEANDEFLLDVSRLSRGKMHLQRGPVLLHHVLDAAIETARPAIEQCGHRLAQRRPPAAVCVDGDLARLSQVFANLLTNAAKYTPQGGAIAIDVDPRPARVEVHVHDTGQGIAPGRLDAIFDLFEQDPAAGTPPPAGSASAWPSRAGSRNCTAARSPRRAPASAPAPPSPCRCRPSPCPTRPGPARHGAAAAPGASAGACSSSTTAWMPPIRPRPCCRSPAARRVVYSGEQVVAAVETFRPEIVLLDLGLPGLDGLEVCRRIRALPEGGALHVVAVTGWGQDEDRRTTREAGFDAHLVKPVASDALLHVVEQAPRAG